MATSTTCLSICNDYGTGAGAKTHTHGVAAGSEDFTIPKGQTLVELESLFYCLFRFASCSFFYICAR